MNEREEDRYGDEGMYSVEETVYEPFTWDGERGTEEYYAAAIAWNETHCAECSARLDGGACPNEEQHNLEIVE